MFPYINKYIKIKIKYISYLLLESNIGIDIQIKNKYKKIDNAILFLKYKNIYNAFNINIINIPMILLENNFEEKSIIFSSNNSLGSFSLKGGREYFIFWVFLNLIYLILDLIFKIEKI